MNFESNMNSKIIPDKKKKKKINQPKLGCWSKPFHTKLLFSFSLFNPEN